MTKCDLNTNMLREKLGGKVGVCVQLLHLIMVYMNCLLLSLLVHVQSTH